MFNEFSKYFLNTVFPPIMRNIWVFDLEQIRSKVLFWKQPIRSYW